MNRGWLHSDADPNPSSDPERRETPAGVPRLFDLVKLRDRKLGVAFYYAMRDTVVAADLEQASRVAYGADKRWAKVVTLKVRSGPAIALSASSVCRVRTAAISHSCTQVQHLRAVLAPPWP